LLCHPKEKFRKIYYYHKIGGKKAKILQIRKQTHLETGPMSLPLTIDQNQEKDHDESDFSVEK